MNHALSRMKNKKRKLHPQGRSQEFSRGKEGGGGMSHFVQQRALNKLSCRPPCRHQLKIKAHTKNPPPPRSFLPSYALDRVKSLLIHEVRFLK